MVPLSFQELPATSKINETYISSTAVCLIDPGSTPTVIRRDLVEALGLKQETSQVRLGVSGVFGDVRTADTVCWITIKFQCDIKITVMAIIVPNMESPVLIGQTDFKRNHISHISKPNLLIFGNHLEPTHTEHLMTEQDIRSFPLKGYYVDQTL